MRQCPDPPQISPPDLPDNKYSDALASKIMIDVGEWGEKCFAKMKSLDELITRQEITKP